MVLFLWSLSRLACGLFGEHSMCTWKIHNLQLLADAFYIYVPYVYVLYICSTYVDMFFTHVFYICSLYMFCMLYICSMYMFYICWLGQVRWYFWLMFCSHFLYQWLFGRLVLSVTEKCVKISSYGDRCVYFFR